MTEYEDIIKATWKDNCGYTKYERKRLVQLQKEILNACSTEENTYSEGEKKLMEERITGETDILLKQIEACMKGDIQASQDIHDWLKSVLLSCQRILALLNELHFPKLKLRCCALTDAAPGVGITNYEVRFRDAETCRMFDSDYRVRVHRS